jgi:nucleoside-triphosphatase
VGQAFLLTGRPGVGKTTVVQAVVARLGGRAGGFYTEEIREGGRRTGFRLAALDGPSGTFASVKRPGRHRVGKYTVHLDELDQVGVAALWRAIEGPQVEVVVVDEIGKMELFSPAFRQAVLAALDSPKAVLATVMARPQPWVDDIKDLPSVTVVEVTLDNRQALPDRVWRWLEGVRAQSPLLDVSPHLW